MVINLFFICSPGLEIKLNAEACAVEIDGDTSLDFKGISEKLPVIIGKDAIEFTMYIIYRKI